MKKFLIYFILILIFTVPSFAKSMKASVTRNSYLDYLQRIELTEKQKEKIEKIKLEEETVLRPMALELSAKENGIEYLKNLKCGAFEMKCKSKLREDKALRKKEQEEAIRKINLKHEYYKTRYRNVLTREQDYQINKMAEEEAYIEKVRRERLKKSKSKSKRRKFI